MIVQAAYMSDRSLVIAFAVCATVFTLPFAATTLYYAFDNEDDSCQKGRRAGLTLSEWLKVTGFIDVAILALYWLLAIVSIVRSADIALMGIFVTVFASSFANFVVWVIGIVLVSTPENRICVADGTELGVMALVNLVLFFITTAVSLTSSPRERG